MQTRSTNPLSLRSVVRGIGNFCQDIGMGLMLVLVFTGGLYALWYFVEFAYFAWTEVYSTLISMALSSQVAKITWLVITGIIDFVGMILLYAVRTSDIDHAGGVIDSVISVFVTISTIFINTVSLELVGMTELPIFYWLCGILWTFCAASFSSMSIWMIRQLIEFNSDR